MGITLLPAALHCHFLCSPGWKPPPPDPIRAVFGAALLRHIPCGTLWSSWSCSLWGPDPSTLLFLPATHILGYPWNIFATSLSFHLLENTPPISSLSPLRILFVLGLCFPPEELPWNSSGFGCWHRVTVRFKVLPGDYLKAVGFPRNSTGIPGPALVICTGLGAWRECWPLEGTHGSALQGEGFGKKKKIIPWDVCLPWGWGLSFLK